jgi:transcriptional regulator
MYVPDTFRIDERAELLAHAVAHPFATVITLPEGTREEDGMAVSHLPLLVDAPGNKLRGHLARENPQRAHFAVGADVLAIFHGPHGYVSPSVYAEQPSVPTWNYVVVHVRGRARLVDEQGLRAILEDTVAHFDRTGWRPEANEQFMRSKLSAIAGFEIEIQKLEGKWKLSQNRSLVDQVRVVSWLQNGDDQSRALAEIMRVRLQRF